MKYLLSFKLFEKKELRMRREAVGTIVPIEELHNYGIPADIIEMMKDWEVCFKSPYSNTFYSSTDIGWGHKPDGSYRVSDHWNFYAHDRHHCQTDKPVPNNSHVSIAKYDKKTGRYNVIKSSQTDEYTNKLKSLADRKEYMKRPEVIEKKKKFKDSIANKEVFAKFDYKDKHYDGIIRKYTGSELKVEDKDGELIFNDNYFRGEISLYDKDGNEIENPYK